MTTRRVQAIRKATLKTAGLLLGIPSDGCDGMVGHDLYGGMTEGGVLIAKIPKCSFFFFREYCSSQLFHDTRAVVTICDSGIENFISKSDKQSNES